MTINTHSFIPPARPTFNFWSTGAVKITPDDTRNLSKWQSTSLKIPRVILNEPHRSLCKLHAASTDCIYPLIWASAILIKPDFKPLSGPPEPSTMLIGRFNSQEGNLRFKIGWQQCSACSWFCFGKEHPHILPHSMSVQVIDQVKEGSTTYNYYVFLFAYSL